MGPGAAGPSAGYEALGAAAGVAIVPHYDARPEPLMAVLAIRAPRDMLMVGIDRDAAMVGRDGLWEVYGTARVTVWRGRRRERHRSGERLPDLQSRRVGRGTHRPVRSRQLHEPAANELGGAIRRM